MENILDYTLLPDGAAALVRAYGDSPLLSLPEALPAPGGMAPLRVLGAYCLAETVRSAPRGPVLRCGRAGDGPGIFVSHGNHTAPNRSAGQKK